MTNCMKYWHNVIKIFGNTSRGKNMYLLFSLLKLSVTVCKNHQGDSAAVAAAATSLQSYLTLWRPHRRQPTRLPIPGILQARTLEWVAISFSNAQKWKVKVKSLSHVRLFGTPWTVAHQAPPSMGFSRQEYQSGVPLLSLVIQQA